MIDGSPFSIAQLLNAISTAGIGEVANDGWMLIDFGVGVFSFALRAIGVCWVSLGRFLV